jgi:SAM-dependent methyltransferase
MKLIIPSANPNTRQYSEDSFSPGGRWERNSGRNQTRLFAECFHRHINVPFAGAFSVLDMGCALGDALPIWKKYYPKSELYGADVAQIAVDRCTEIYGDIAHFFRASFEEIDQNWDVIYCSNVLEHFEQHVEIAEMLLNHCKILYVMTPYLELDNGKRLTSPNESFHVATLDKTSFSPLVEKGLATISTRVIRCPLAWSPDWKGEIVWQIKRLFRVINSNPRRQIIYSIYNIKYLNQVT